MFEQFEKQIKNCKKIVFVTGAGISQESGIPTFRGENGLWKNYDSMQLATIDAFNKNPKLVWEWYNERRRNIISAHPNEGHKAISRLEEFAKVVVLTQNIDGLHQKAGSTNVLELHGSIIRIKCTKCTFNNEIFSEYKEFPPLCECGGILRPDVIWFGEPLPQDIWRQAMEHASNCDLMIIAGTSLVVSPANILPIYAKQKKSILIEVNLEETEMSDLMDLSIRNSCAITLPNLLKIF